MKQKRKIVILMFVMAVMLTACSKNDEKNINQVSETEVDVQPTESEPTESELTESELTESEPAAKEDTMVEAQIDMPILDEINQNVEVGTTGAYMTAVQAAESMMDWGTGTGLDPQEIKDATTAWLMNKGNDEQVAFAEKLKRVDDAYHKLLETDAPVESIEAVMDAVGLRPYEETGTESEDWKIAFEESLMENYQVTVDHYEDLGDGIYQVYVVIDGKAVPYVTVDSKTGDYHG